jgi:thiol-disulfide isomerase/thioredoxin
MTTSRLFVAIGLAAVAAGALLWKWAPRPAGSPPATLATIAAPDIGPAAIFAATFGDAAGRRRSLGEFEGKLLVVNFWATWCGPCRAEMPAFHRVQTRWAGRVQFVGLSGEPPEAAERFGRELGIGYPLWTAGDQVQELSRRLGNRLSVLPHTVILGPRGQVLDQRVGPYTEDELDAKLQSLSLKSAKSVENP